MVLREKQTWILLRGLTRESGHWGDFLPQLAAALPEASIVPLDLPGNGALHMQASPWRVEAMAQHCREQLASLQLAPPYHLLALSLGGMVAVAWSVLAPHELARLVLINTSMRPFSPFYQRLRPSACGTVLRVLLGGSSPEAWEEAVLRLTANFPHPGILEHWLKLHRSHPVSRRNALAQLVAASRFRAPEIAAPMPALILASEGDRLVDAACSRAIARSWRCPADFHPSAGHDLPLDDGAWVAARVRAWINGEPPSDQSTA